MKFGAEEAGRLLFEFRALEVRLVFNLGVDEIGQHVKFRAAKQGRANKDCSIK
jgi:hypothetical protein